mgnify:FL=1|tara:strand:- start:52 stop:354 length:303 start_codon:yes stop_codon:yes gene_type:complete
MLSIPKVMIFLLIVLSTLMYWTTSNVCRYNFTVEKKTDKLNILLSEIDPSIPMARVYYFKELNCNTVDLSWDYERVIKNFKILSVIIYQEFTTDIRGNPN